MKCTSEQGHSPWVTANTLWLELFQLRGRCIRPVMMVLGDSEVLEDVLICEDCLSEFRRESWIEIRKISKPAGDDDVEGNDR